jgi:hypothetical protein
MMRCFALSAFFLIVLLSGCATERSQPLAIQDPPAGGFSFAVIGCLGYRPEHEPWLENLLTDLNKTPLAFVVHVGDLGQPPLGSCTDELWARRLAQFQASAHPVIYTPGDNEWTDCHEPNVKGGDPLERLEKLRSVFFSGDQTLGRRTFALTRQSQSADPALVKFRENVRWDLGGVTYVTLHVVGSNNGRGRTSEGDAEYRERNRANLAWLQQGFAHAKVSHSRAVVIMQQANPFPEFPPFPGTAQNPSGFTDLRVQLQKEATGFGKPVVLIHADSHFFRVDKPLGPRGARDPTVIPALENFTRVETFGTPYHHWVQVTADASDPYVFTFRPRIVAANLTQRQ